MEYSLDARTARLSVGEFSDFTLGPRDSSGGPHGLWRAQLGTYWHQQLRALATTEHAAAAEFEIPVDGRVFHRGWTIALNGRIDQILRLPSPETCHLLSDNIPAPPPSPLPPPPSPASDACHLLSDNTPAPPPALPPPPPSSAPDACHLLSDNTPAPRPALTPDRCHLIGDNLTPAPPSAHALRPGSRLTSAPTLVLREIKTVTRPLPADEAELRRDYPAYFTQLATYFALTRLTTMAALPDPAAPRRQPPPEQNTVPFPPRPASSPQPAQRPTLRSELIFVEAGSGLSQTLALTASDEALFRVQLERIAEFLDLRLRARERLRHLRYRSAFASPRPGQETTAAELTAAFERHPAIYLEAPTGFGKTGVLLEFALGQLRSGHFDRALYLTSKATGQLQVVRTLAGMTSPDTLPTGTPAPATGATTSVAVWHVRNKAEHCVNTVFDCRRDVCPYLADLETRWAASGLARFYLLDGEARDLPSLRTAGRAARICPYEITRAALAFNDVWIGDYNYVFAPANRSLFYNQPGFDPARTLLLIDEAHNLPTRVADAHSHNALASDARALLSELDHLSAPAPFIRLWESWTMLLAALPAADSLDPALEADVADTLAHLTATLANTPLDYAALGPQLSAILWQTQALQEWLVNPLLKKLLWSPRAAELSFTCIDAAEAIGGTLRSYGGVVLASATLAPTADFTESIGLESTAPLSPHPTTPAPAPASPFAATIPLPSTPEPFAIAPPLLAPTSSTAPLLIRAATPWRDAAYDLAYDLRVDTSFRERSRHHATTAATVAALHAAAQPPRRPSDPQLASHGPRAIAVFFPSYAYAETIAREIYRAHPALRVALQPRLSDLAAQTAWVEESLALTDALFLVLGSSFAESIDLLGGRVTHAMVVGPALPEVNAVQRARLSEFSPLGREAAFRRVYQIPGMNKVNQALGRLVRAPGQRARVLLHCRRFAEISYARLLAHDYQFGKNILDDADLAAWLAA